MKFLSGQWEHPLTKSAPGSMKSHLRRAHGNTQFLGDRIVGKVIDVSEDNDRAQPRRQVTDRLVDLVPKVDEIGLQCRIVIGSLLNDERLVRQLFVAVAASLPSGRRRTVGDDPVQPRAELCIAAETIEASVGPQVGVLHHISSILLIARETERQPERIAMSPVHHLVERLALTRHGSLDEFVHGGVFEVGPVVGRGVT